MHAIIVKPQAENTLFLDYDFKERKLSRGGGRGLSQILCNMCPTESKGEPMVGEDKKSWNDINSVKFCKIINQLRTQATVFEIEQWTW